jgi:chorismate synthase
MPPLVEAGWARLGWPFALTWLAYAVAGGLALLMAVPPGYATPLYPAAGIALASVLVFGWRMLGAVALGSFCVNAALVAARGGHDLLAFALPVGIGVAAAVQAGVGAALVRRFVRQPLTLTLPADVALFLAACLIASVVAPSLATLLLRAAGVVPGSAWLFTWGTWWIGDLAGMLIAAPIALTLIGRPRSEWSPRRIPVGLTLALVTAFLALGIVQVGRWNAERVRSAFNHDASNASLILMTQLQEPLRALEALRGVFSVSRQPSRAEMRAATENWLGSGAVRAMGWSERVRREDLAAFEARARADGNPGFRVFDRPDAGKASSATAIDRIAPETRIESGDVVAIRQIEPLDGNATALGVNAMSVPAARAAILAAVETGRPAATAGFRLTQQSESDAQMGVVVYQAIYDREVSSPMDRRAAFRGVVFVSLGMDAQLASLLGKVPGYLELCVVDADHLATRLRIAGRAGCEALPAGLMYERPYAFAGRQWDLRVTALPQAVPDGHDRRAWLFSAAGLLSAAMLGASLLITTGRTRRIESAVRERTAELAEWDEGGLERLLAESPHVLDELFDSDELEEILRQGRTEEQGGVDAELARRQGGYGRGGRQKLEVDTVEIQSGVWQGVTLGSPLTLAVSNRDSKLERLKEVERPRPGHGDLTGAIKYLGSIRGVLERASARETAARVAAGTLAHQLLAEFGVTVFGFVLQLEQITTVPRSAPLDELRAVRDASPMYTLDPNADPAIVARVDQATEAGDTLGGIVEVQVQNLPFGLGSHAQWDRKLDGLLAQAVMSIQAIKGVEIGLGFEAARRPGSQVHDEIAFDAAQSDRPALGYVRRTNNAGGLEAGMTNGQPLVLRAAMKPISTLRRPLASINLATKEVESAAYERSDVCALAACSVIVENVVAFTVAQAFIEKFGGDSVSDDDKLLNFFAGAEAVAAMKAASAPKVYPSSAGTPLVALIEQLSRRKGATQIYVKREGFSLRLERKRQAD